MTQLPFVALQHLSCFTDDQKKLFDNLSLVFGFKKIGVVGKNGIGKSTLFRLITGEREPTSGTIRRSGQMAYCPQELMLDDSQTVADLLGVSEKLAALSRIYAGKISESDYTLVENAWSLPQDINFRMDGLGLSHIDLNRSANTLSGGELTRILIAKAFLKNADFTLLDEPTNHLDHSSREKLYAQIQLWKKGLIIISHDRELLSLMDEIVELSSLGVQIYGGNYEDYLSRKEREEDARAHDLALAEKKLMLAKRSVQDSREKKMTRTAKGKRLRRTGGQSKLVLNGWREQSTAHQKCASRQSEALLAQAKINLDQAKSQVAESEKINIRLPNTRVPNNKIVLRCRGVGFQYSQATKPAIENLNFEIRGATRIGIIGENGVGKSTLLQLIQGALKPTQGSIDIGVSNIAYLDQSLDFLAEEKSILENYRRMHADVSETQTRIYLADFLFYDDDVFKKISLLSAGEKMRVALACLLAQPEPSQFFILDEPSRYLDLESLFVLESVLKKYEGALLVVSHDDVFLEKIGIQKIIHFTKAGMTLDRYGMNV